MFVKVSCAVGVSVSADLTVRNVPAKCTYWMGYRTPGGRRSNRKVADIVREVNFVESALFRICSVRAHPLLFAGVDAWKWSYLDAEDWVRVPAPPESAP